MFAQQIPRLIATIAVMVVLVACTAESVPPSLLLPSPTPSVLLETHPPSAASDLPAAQIFAELSPAVAYVETPIASGSSVLVTGGYLLTNAHVVWPYATARIVFPNGEEHQDVPVAGWDLMADLALIGPVETDVPPVNLVDGGTINIGEDVYLIGYPSEVDEFPQPTITNGILSRLRTWETIDYTFYQVDATTVGGQSGGIMVTHGGDVVGISTFYYDGFGMAGAVVDALPRLNALLGHATDVEMVTAPLTVAPPRMLQQGTLEDELADAVFILDEPVGTEVEVNVAGRGKPALRVVGPHGFPVAYSEQPDADAQEVSLEFTIDDEGPHFIEVTQPSPNRNEFELTTSVPTRRHVDRDDVTTLSVGQNYLGAIDLPGDADIFTLTLAKDERVEITVDALSLNPRVALGFESPTHQFFVLDDNSGGGIFGENAKIVVEAPEDGDYKVMVGSTRYTGVGGYFVTLAEADPEAEVTESDVDRTNVRTSYGPMSWYEDETYDFALLYPAQWEEIPLSDCMPQATACFQGPLGGVIIAPEHLSILPKADRNRTRYVEILQDLFALTDQITVDQHIEMETLQGFPADRFILSNELGYAKIDRMTVVNEERQLAYNVIFVFQDTYYPQSTPMIDFIFESFRDWDGVDETTSPVYYLDQGAELASQGDREAALEAYNTALDLQPDFVTALWRRAWVQYRQGDSDAALQDLSRAIELAPERAALVSDRATLHWYLEESDAALADMTRALELSPDNSNFLNLRALIHVQRGDFAAALQDVAQAEELHDNDLPPNILDTRGFIYLMMDDFAKAKEDYDIIFGKDVHSAYTLLGRGIAYVNTGEITEGLALIEEGMQLFEEDAKDDPDFPPEPQIRSLKAMAESLVAEYGDATGSD